MAESGQQGVTYEKVGREYFEQRKLRRHAGVFSLWALGVGAVISGQFSGWNYGLEYGWGSMFVATVIITIMYIGLTYSIAEMSPALPHTGGAYSFARSALGPWGGFFTGVAENIEYVVTPAVVVYFIGSYVSGILQLSGVVADATEMQPLFWLGGYMIFVGFNLFGVELSFRVTVIVTMMALVCLAVFYMAAIPQFDFARWAMNVGVGPDGSTVELTDGSGTWFPRGVDGVLAALPFAVWLYLAIEQLPLAAEESADPKRDMPRSILLGMLTLSVSAFLVLILNSGIAPGSFGLRASGEPLLEGFRTLFGKELAIVLSLVAITGLIASFHAIIYAYGRQIYSLSRAGYFPRFLSVTHGSHQTPQVALIAGAVVGFGLMAVIWYSNDQATRNTIIGTYLLNMAVFGAMISYVFQALSFIVLRLRMPHIERPYRSPFGIPGAAVTLVIALVTMAFQFIREDFREPVIWVASYYALMMLYFAVIGRNQLVLSPEEEFALSGGKTDYKSH
jgi:ethanolamine permease